MTQEQHTTEGKEAMAVGAVIGRIVGAEPDNEADHFILCGDCGQAIDCRNLSEVFRHEEPGHKPMGRQ